jgi:hypothetical protein
VLTISWIQQRIGQRQRSWPNLRKDESSVYDIDWHPNILSLPQFLMP